MNADTNAFTRSLGFQVDDGTIESLSWDFGDGTAPGTGAIANHTYATAGDYVVNVEATDDGGSTDTSDPQSRVTQCLTESSQMVGWC